MNSAYLSYYEIIIVIGDILKISKRLDLAQIGSHCNFTKCTLSVLKYNTRIYFLLHIKL